MSEFSGVYPILYAFYDKSGKLDDGLMRLQVEKCIATGAAGIAVLGLVTEVHKLDVNERRHLVEVVGRAINGRVPYAVTVGELSTHGQIEFAKMAQANGASWVILQPPSIKGYSEAEYLRFLGTVADALDLPVAVQNNPVNMDVSLTNASLLRLRQEHPNITMLKGEGPALGVAELVRASEGKYAVFAGHGGKEYISNVLSGCVGLIPAPDCLDHHIRLHALLTGGKLEEAEALHARLLPLVLLMTNSVPNLLCYGKRLFAERIGITEIHMRAPDMLPTEFGLSEVKRMTRDWGPLLKEVHPLQIVGCRHWKVAMPFKEALHWGSGKRPATTRLIVELELANGIRGYGETICLLEFIEPVLVNTVFPIALQHCAQDVEALCRHVSGAGYYHHKRAAVMAMAAVEMAMWDAQGKASGQPLWALWGGKFREEVAVSAYLFGTDAAALKTSAQRFLDAGYSSFKVKIGMDMRSDISNVEAVRSTVGDAPLRADVNSAWTPGTARRMLERLRPLDLQYVEQPLELDDLQGHAELRQMQPVPIALDESAYTLADVGNIVRASAADVILLDPHEIGGLWQTVKAAAIAESVGIPVTLHSGGELGLSQSAYIHLAASIPNLSISIDSERDYLSDDVVTEAPRIRGGAFAVPSAPGLGVAPDFEKIRQYQTDAIRGAYLDASRPGWYATKPAY